MDHWSKVLQKLCDSLMKPRTGQERKNQSWYLEWQFLCEMSLRTRSRLTGSRQQLKLQVEQYAFPLRESKWCETQVGMRSY